MTRFDQIWIDNRFRFRKGMRGTAMRLDDHTGYLESTTRRGFTVEMKATFIKRFTVCSNKKQIVKSVDIDIQSVYDALCLDKKFREDFLKCEEIPGRSKQLNDELKVLAASEKAQIVTDLTKKLENYR